MAVRLIAAAAVGVALALGLAVAAEAQLSPGKLSQPHAELEGAKRCLDCHDARQGVSPDGCLECHQPLARRIRAGQGLHARPEYRDCATCHIEHHGREFELVWWGEEGRDAFDHALTGHRLEGAHAELGCRDCHRPDLIRDPALAATKDLARTFLGLGRDCTSCHRDPHQGEFTDRSCTDCHDQFDWESASAGFDHSTTGFPLTGRHVGLDCVKCHAGTSGGAEALRFAGVAFGSCSDCHADPHAGRFGRTCATCHVTSGWGSVDLDDFDHRRTRFALVGAHRDLSCESCHAGGQFGPLRFGRCSDCHEDPHVGQFDEDCASCHTVDSFRPTTFSIERHQASSFPLVGAHGAVPCDACHAPTSTADLPGVPAALWSRTPEAVRFRFERTDCLACHEDPHASGAVTAECTRCHLDTSWQEPFFDHDTTGFELTGRHAGLTCSDCHRPSDDATAAVSFAALDPACVSCHGDRHRGQFADRAAGGDCAACHAPDGWEVAAFDHELVFPLRGAHAAVECAACHPTETDAEGSFRRFRPRPRDCAGCHS